MKQRKFSAVLILGIVLVAVSFLLIVTFQLRAYWGAAESEKAVTGIHERLPDTVPGVPGMYSNPNMPVLEINGTDYVALLEIPAFQLTLPVADSWNSQKLDCGPARFYGSCYDQSLVIGGTDNSHQFSFCDRITQGTVITVTDMTGARFSYTVSRVDRCKSTENSWLISKEYDLTLFCRDAYSMEYIAVRCIYG